MHESALVIRAFERSDRSTCEGILRALPDWFGIEEAIVSYAEDTEMMETWIAEWEGSAVGFLTVKRPNPYSAEIQVMAVAQSFHGRGIGRALIEHAEAVLRRSSTEYLQVKTLGPSRPNAHYERTRGFYSRLGFRPLEENDLWGKVNPCLIMIKHLPCSGGGA